MVAIRNYFGDESESPIIGHCLYVAGNGDSGKSHLTCKKPVWDLSGGIGGGGVYGSGAVFGG